MASYDLKQIDTEAIAKFVTSLQQPDGSFAADEWGIIDTCFSYCALSILSLLSSLDRVDIPKAVEYIASCQNFDAGQAFNCIGALSVAIYTQSVIKICSDGGWQNDSVILEA